MQKLELRIRSILSEADFKLEQEGAQGSLVLPVVRRWRWQFAGGWPPVQARGRHLQASPLSLRLQGQVAG